MAVSVGSVGSAHRDLSVAVLITDKTGGADLDSGAASVDEVIRGDWVMSLDRAKSLRYLIAIRREEIFQVRRILGVEQRHSRPSRLGRPMSVVRFTIEAAPELQHLIGQPVPDGRMRNPVKYVETARLLLGDVPISDGPAGRRAVIGAITLLVDRQGNAQVTVPAGTTISIRTVRDPSPRRGAT